MVHFEPLSEECWDRYPAFDRSLVFDESGEVYLLKAAAAARSARRVMGGADPFLFDITCLKMVDDLPNCFVNVGIVHCMGELLTEVAGDDFDDPELSSEKRGKMRDMGAEVVLLSRVYDETRALDYDAFLDKVISEDN